MLQEEKKNDINKTNSKKNILSLVALLVVIGIAAAGICIGLLNGNFGNNQVVSETPNSSEDEIVSGNVKASDEKTLREFLLKEGTATINLTEDIEIQRELVVNGNKTLTGNKTITMWLAAVDEQAVLAVNKDASLSIEGINLDGNGISDGVRVEEGASLDYSKGTMLYTAEYGIKCLGKATLEKVSVENAQFCGVYVAETGEAHLKSCSMKDVRQTFVHVAEGGYAEVTGEGTYENCIARSFSNEGKLDVNGESTTSDEDQPIKLVNTYYAFVNLGKGELSLCGVSVDSSHRSAVSATGGVVTVENSFFKKQNYATLQADEDTIMTVKNVSIEEGANAGIYASDTSQVTVDGLLVEKCRHGIVSCGGKVTGQDITVKDSVLYGVASTHEEENRGYIELTNFTAEAAGRAGIYGNEGELIITNGSINNSVTYGVQLAVDTVATLTNVDVKNSKDHNYWINEGTKCILKGKSVVTGAAVRNIYTNGVMVVEGASISDTNCNGSGTGVFIDAKGNFSMTGGTFKNNSTAQVGGAIYVKGGVANLKEVAFDRNTAQAAGGAIRVNSGTVNAEKCSFTNNKSANSSGGAITVEGAKVTIKDSSFSANTAKIDGGALHVANDAAEVSVDSCEFTENVATGSTYSAGGAIIKTLGNCSVSNCSFSENSASYLGGAIENRVGNFQANNCTFENNTAVKGGAISQNGAGNTTLHVEKDAKGIIRKNTASDLGGAIYINSEGTVTVNGYNVLENQSKSAGGAVHVNNGNAIIKNSNIENNTSGAAGAAIRLVKGELTVDNSTFASNNSPASSGGAITVQGAKATISNTIFTENKAKGEGGAVQIDSDEANVTVSGCTFAKNSALGNQYSAGGAIFVNKGACKAVDSKFLENTAGYLGGAVENRTGTFQGINCTFENNTAVKGAAVSQNGAGTTTFAVESGKKGVIQKNEATDVGGALYVNSEGTVLVDGYSVLENESSSAGGAVYVNSGNVTINSTKVKDNVSGAAGAGVRLVAGQLTVDGSTFEGNSSPVSSGGAITVQGAKAVISNTVFKGNSAKAEGGALQMDSDVADVTLNSCTFSKNSASGNQYSAGGAIFVNKGNCKANNTTFVENTAGYLGGAVENRTGTFQGTNCTFEKNTTVKGGAISQNGAGTTTLIVEVGNSGIIQNNVSTDVGGAVYVNSAGTLTVNGYSISDNQSTYAGGAIYINNGNVTINNSGLQKNVSGAAGAAIRFAVGELTINNCTFAGNSSPASSGGAITVQGAKTTISNTIFTENSAKNEGGALQIDNASAKVTLDTCTFTKNTASGNQYAAGGAIFANNGDCQAVNTTFAGNIAGYLGGAVENRNGAFQGINCTFEKNTAVKGGAISQNGAGSVMLQLQESGSGLFEGNTASGNGGAVLIQNGAASIDGYVFKDNTAAKGKAVYVLEGKKLVLNDCSFTNNGEIKFGNAAIAELSGNLAGATIVNEGAAEAVLTITDALEESAENIVTITPASYTTGSQILSRGDDVTDEEWQYACEHISITPKEEDDSWYIDNLGKLQSLVKENVAFITMNGNTDYYKTFDEAIEAANAAGGTGTTDPIVITLLENASINSQINIEKNITVMNAKDKDITLTRGASYTGNLLDMNVDNITFTLGNNAEDATGSITVSAASANAIGGRTVFNHKDTSTFILAKNATLTGAKSTAYGAALANVGTAHLYGNMTNNSSSCGAAINHASKKGLSIYSGNYTKNTASSNGAVIFSQETGTITISGGTFSDNKASSNGGAIFSQSAGKIIISGGIFFKNSANKGGAILCEGFPTDGYKLTVTGGTFEENSAKNNADSGGAIYLNKTKAQISGGLFTKNIATYRGGAIQCTGTNNTTRSVLDITGGTFTYNQSNGQGGGAISVIHTTATIDGATIQNNISPATNSQNYMGGGALLIQENATVTLSNCANFNGNTTAGTVANVGFDIAFRGQNNAKLVLADETYGGYMGCVFGDVVVNVTIGNGTPIPLTKGTIYTADYANKTLKEAQ